MRPGWTFHKTAFAIVASMLTTFAILSADRPSRFAMIVTAVVCVYLCLLPEEKKTCR